MKKAGIGIAAIAAFMGTAASAADMAVKAPAPAYNWTGFTVGGDLGGAWTGNIGTWNPLPSPAASGFLPEAGSNGGSGFIGGLHAGYDWQFTPTWVAGLEGDWSWAKTGGTFSQPWIFAPAGGALAGSQTTMSSTLDWLASLRARFGFLVTPDLLAYGTGGAAWARIEYAASNHNAVGNYFTNAATSSTQPGYAIGGGVEWMITRNWLVRAEYLYYRFTNAPNIVGIPPPVFANFPAGYTWSSTSVNVGRVGLSYKF